MFDWLTRKSTVTKKLVKFEDTFTCSSKSRDSYSLQGCSSHVTLLFHALRMSTTPGKSIARASGIPTPGKSSNIPTPGRFRSSSSTNPPSAFESDVEYMSRAFANAIKANDPARHRTSTTSNTSPSSSSPKSNLATLQSGRRSVTGRPSSVASTSTFPQNRAKTPAPRPASRQSDVFTRSVSRAGKTFEVGDNVRIESLGYEGRLRYLGEIDGKSGLWAGVELSGGFSNKGKNDGSVGG